MSVGVPAIEVRIDQPYMAIKSSVTLVELGGLGSRVGDVFAWVVAHGLVPVGPPFFKYNVIDMERELEVEVGLPVAATADGDGNVVPGVLPSGRYATLVYTGHPQGLVDATTTLLEWAAERGSKWDVSPSDNGERWASRLEIYLTDPAEEPDMDRWQTQLAFRLAD